MKITEGAVSFASKHQLKQTYTEKEEFEVWARPTNAATQTAGVGQDEASFEISNKRALTRLILEKVLGIALKDQPDYSKPDEAEASQEQQPSQEGSVAWGFRYHAEATYSREEQTQFAAEGWVQTADGRTIDFNYSLDWKQAQEYRASVTLTAGQPKDPLLLNFSGTPNLSQETFEIDLDLNGVMDQIRKPGSGQAYLVQDLDGSGDINHAHELFGPKTNDGFAELAALDEDGNGWIDESDKAFEDLRLWFGGDSLQSLGEAGVGAIHTVSVATPFQIEGGTFNESGIFLTESGDVKAIQRVDYEV